MLLILSPLVSLVATIVYQSDADRGERGSITSGLTLDYYQGLSINPRQDYFYIPPIIAIWNSVKYGVDHFILQPHAWINDRLWI